MTPIAVPLATALLAIAMPASAQYVKDQSACQWNRQCLKIGDPELALIRGGFAIDTPAGRLEIAIGITRAVAINGQLVAVSQLVLPDAAQIAAAARAQAEAAIAASGVTSAQTTLSAGGTQSATAGTGAQASANAAAVASSAGVASASQRTAGGTSAPASPNTAQGQNAGVSSPGSTGGELVLTLPKVTINGIAVTNGAPVAIGQSQAIVVQNGPGNVANMSAALMGSSLPTVIQNTLNGQSISSATLINITSNSLSALRQMTFGDLLRSATVQSAR